MANKQAVEQAMAPQRAQAQQLGVEYDHVEGVARALGQSQALGGNWQTWLQVILAVLTAIKSVSPGGTNPNAPPVNPTNPPA